MSFLSQLEWRHAAKEFDRQKPVHEQDLAKILRAVRMAPSSFGLQPYHIVSVSDDAIKEHIREHAWGQPQVTTCTYLLVFCTCTDADEKRIDQLLGLMGGS